MKHPVLLPKSDMSLDEYRREYRRIVEAHKKLMMRGKPQNKSKRLLVVVVPVVDARLRLLAQYRGVTISKLLNYLILNSLSLEDEEAKLLP